MMGAFKDFFAFVFGLLFHNLITKLLCLLMAFLLYVYVNTSENIDRDFLIPLSLANRPADMLVTYQSASEVRVVINGPRAKMDQLKVDNLSVTLSLRESQRPGEVAFRLYPDQVTTPPGLRVRSIEPTSVTLRLEPIVAKTVKIQAVLEGKPPEGYEVAEIKVSTPLIEVAGPPSLLGKLDVLETEPVDIEGMTQSVRQRVDLRVPNLVSLSARHATLVVVTIREKTLQRTLESVPVRPASGRTDLFLEPRVVSVQLEGPYSIVQSLTPSLVEPIVPDEGLSPGQTTQKRVVLRAVPPQRVDVRIEPDEVRVTMPTPPPTAEPSPAESSPAGPPARAVTPTATVKAAKPARSPRPRAKETP